MVTGEPVQFLLHILRVVIVLFALCSFYSGNIAVSKIYNWYLGLHIQRISF